ncbi:hypothetical protein BWI15_09635 [Kribbella sp. ALI-6-A]|uniref:hypothetical protein n=1 Tax=Kribbella sp. ALI-6-A TaxID=1933817 RepID=UPI00097CB9E2|nr:hypothetical protein [Kribbella sp. ALI-6-A]ONI73687.1 hypothetical protein BWI15_09635 [Kribbella sp. ALI-6-A]
MTDTAAAERMADRLLAVSWNNDLAFDAQRSRFRLTREFLRRTALWGQSLGVTARWPFFDLAEVLDPEVVVDPVLVEKLQLDPATAGTNPVPPGVAVNIVRWAALGDLPRQRFPELDDPYEPLIALFERGGAFTVGNGLIELGYGSFTIGDMAARAALEPAPIDEATLDALDEES